MTAPSGIRIGIDLGGTKIAGLAITRDGRTLAQRRTATPQGDYGATVTTITEVVRAGPMDRSRIMLCGNPEMVEDSRALLISRGFRMSRRAEPGHLAVENYW